MSFDNAVIIKENNNFRVYALCIDSEQHLWIGTANGIYKINFNKQFYNYDGILENNAVFDIVSIDKKIFWFKTSEGLIKYNSITRTIEAFWQDLFFYPNYTSTRMNFLCISNDGTLWAGTEGLGLQRFNPTTEDLITYNYDPNNENSISSNTIISLSADLNGNVWIGTDSGLCSFNTATEIFTRYLDNTAYPESIRNGSVWITYILSNNKLCVGTDMGFF
jgi:ligand-binding sensor domain-containing protein